MCPLEPSKTRYRLSDAMSILNTLKLGQRLWNSSNLRMVPFTLFNSITLTKPSDKRKETARVRNNYSKRGLLLSSPPHLYKSHQDFSPLLLHTEGYMGGEHPAGVPGTVELRPVGQCEWWEEARIGDAVGAFCGVFAVSFVLPSAKRIKGLHLCRLMSCPPMKSKSLFERKPSLPPFPLPVFHFLLLRFVKPLVHLLQTPSLPDIPLPPLNCTNICSASWNWPCCLASVSTNTACSAGLTGPLASHL